MNNNYPPAAYHLPLRELMPGVWLASSRISMSIPLRRKIAFSRNMVAVLGLDFDNLIAGHGTPKMGGARTALAKNVAQLP